MQDPALSVDTNIFAIGVKPSTIEITATPADVGTYLLYYVGQVKETNGNVFIQKSEPFSVNITNNCINPAIYSIPIED
jgi:hypothetical protein